VKLQNSYENLLEKKNFDIIRKTAEEEKTISDEVIVENLLSVYINGLLRVKIPCTPGNLAELVLGYLFTEGIIETVEEVDLIDVCEFGSRAIVRLMQDDSTYQEAATQEQKDSHVRSLRSGCSEPWVFDLLQSGSGEPEKKLPSEIRPIEWKPEDIFMLASFITRESKLFLSTGGTHSCALGIKDEKGAWNPYFCEDIGRHNAVDKVIGCALRDNMDLSKGILFTSGRIPSDMALKAVKSRIPVIASHSAPTDKAILIAREYGLTLIGFTRNGRMNVYSKGE
jgi:FdhD protein